MTLRPIGVAPTAVDYPDGGRVVPARWAQSAANATGQHSLTVDGIAGARTVAALTQINTDLGAPTPLPRVSSAGDRAWVLIAPALERFLATMMVQDNSETAAVHHDAPPSSGTHVTIGPELDPPPSSYQGESPWPRALALAGGLAVGTGVTMMAVGGKSVRRRR